MISISTLLVMMVGHYTDHSLNPHFETCNKLGIMNLDRAISKTVSPSFYTRTQSGLPSIMYTFPHATWTPSPFFAYGS